MKARTGAIDGTDSVSRSLFDILVDNTRSLVLSIWQEKLDTRTRLSHINHRSTKRS